MIRGIIIKKFVSRWIVNMKIYYDDSSKEAWKFYKSQYTSLDWGFWGEFDFDNVKTRYEKDGKYNNTRYLLWIKDNSKLISELGALFSFGGEKLFNFKTQYYNLKKIVDVSSNNDKKCILSLLEECMELHSSEQNLAILPTTGGLNNVKGSLYFDENGNIRYSSQKISGKQLDRLDTFLAIVKDYFDEKSDTILSYTKGKPNEQYLINFLEKFDNVYDFAEKMYRLNDKVFIDKMVQNGRKPIMDADDVERYCRLAKEFWEFKQSLN
ncbi:hypothetical protein [Streptococcus suis]|uniref:hypothetical protein n=1 Tax=Streptococcus suis TaxID=1307 RepID=UPI000CF6E21E|nr:hypothetical protein [Streptococcus suis]